MEYYIFLGVIALFMVFLFIRGSIDERRTKKKFRENLIKNYGQPPFKETQWERLPAISMYFQKHKKAFYIDDITWNDLDMDRIFSQMNYACSSAGEEYLYYTLRTPSLAEKELQDKEALIAYFMENEQERVNMQMHFEALGRTGKFSIYDYLDYLDNLGERSNFPHYAALIAYAAGIIGLFIDDAIGLMLLILVAVLNMIFYFKEKRQNEPYLTSFSYLLRILDTADIVAKDNNTILEKENRILRENRKKFKEFTKKATWILGGNAGGSMTDLFMDYIRMLFHIDLIQFNRMLSIVRGQKEELDQCITTLGYIETAIIIGAYRAWLPCYALPVFTEQMQYKAVDLYHPLINNPVANSIATTKGVLLTGSNASGKSTFLKTAALNALLAQSIHTSIAKSYTGTMYKLYSSMSLKDDLVSGDSYYMVEIKSLKRILDAAVTKEYPILCFVDEVLRGTNTVERIAASTQILKSLSEEGILCFAATHDIELTHLLEGIYNNYHFEEEIVGEDVQFNYSIQDGRAVTRNAIRLLAVMGYEEDIINRANKMAKTFVDTKEWSL